MDTRARVISDRLMARPAVFTAGVMLTGIYLTYYSGSVYPSLILLTILIVVSAVIFRKTARYMVFAGASCLLCLISCLSMNSINNAVMEVTGAEICEQVRVIAVKRDLDGSAAIYVRFINGSGAALYLSEYDPGCHPGADVVIRGVIRCPDQPANPGGFDMQGYLRRKGIRYVLDAEDIIPVRGNRFSSVFNDLIFDARSFIFSSMTPDMDPEERSLFAAICMGDTSFLEPEMRSLFSVSGCSHLIAVSGTHFSGFTAILAFMFNSGDRKGRYRIFMCLLFLMFGFLTGFGDSVSRALIMSICAMFSRDRLSGMGLAVSVMAVSDPFGLLSQGFIMSIAAVSGMTLFVPVMKRLPDMISYPIAAHIGLLPFFGINSMSLSLQSFACQIAGGFIVSVICLLFVPVMIISVAVSGYASLLIAGLIKLLSFILRSLSSLGLWRLNCADIGTEVFIAILIFLTVMVMPDCMVRKVLFIPSFVYGALGAGVILYRILFPCPLTAVFIDVGQGDSCLIITPSCSILIDGGRYNEGEEILSVLDHYGIYSVDLAIVSHWDSDHCGGICYLEDHGRTGKVIAPCECVFDNSDDLYIEDVYVSRAGDIFDIGQEVYISMISPDEDNAGENDDSLVFYVESEYVRMLFTGDIGIEKEEELAETGRITDCDILKVAHHGSRYSTGRGFLELSSPETAVISCGRDNSYGHPSGETLAKLDEFGSDIRRTDLEGAIVFEFNRTY